MPAGPGRVIALEGGSASGKTSLVRVASRALGWTPLWEAFDRLDPAPSLEFASPSELLRIEGSLLAEETRRFREAMKAVRAGTTVLADTGFLGPVTYTWGLAQLGRVPRTAWSAVERSARSLLRRGALGLPELTVYLDTTARERTERAAADRGKHPAVLAPRHERVGAVERPLFRRWFPEQLPTRFAAIPGHATPQELVEPLRAIVARIRPRPATPADALSVLAVLDRVAVPAGRTPARPNR